jgi:putative Mn2+ efflux pump MntP
VGESTEGRAKSLFLVSLGLLFVIIGFTTGLLLMPSSGPTIPVPIPRLSLFSPPVIGMSLLTVLGFFMIMGGVESHQHWARDLANLFKRAE